MDCLVSQNYYPHEKKWDDFVSGFENGHHHLHRFISSLSYGLNQEAFFITCEEDGEIVGVLPMLGAKSFIFGDQLTSLPHFNYGGALTKSEKAKEALYHKALDVARENGYKKILLRDSESLPGFAEKLGWGEQTHKVNMCYELPSDIKKIGVGNAKKKAKLRSQARLAKRKADDLGITVTQLFGKEDLLDDFYTVFSRHMRDLGTPVLGKAFFRCQLRNKEFKLTVVYWDGEPVAAGALLEHSNERVSIPWASTLYKVNPYSVNAFMYHNIIERLINKGVKTFDFGRSTIGEGTYKFKEQWGAIPETCHWHVFEFGSSKEDLENTEMGTVMKLLVSAWKKMPLFLTNKLGPILIRNTGG